MSTRVKSALRAYWWGVLVVWTVCAGVNIVSGIHELLGGHWVDATFLARTAANGSVIAFVAVLGRAVLRPRLAVARRAVRDQEARERQARIAELEREVGFR